MAFLIRLLNGPINFLIALQDALAARYEERKAGDEEDHTEAG